MLLIYVELVLHLTWETWWSEVIELIIDPCLCPVGLHSTVCSSESTCADRCSSASSEKASGVWQRGEGEALRHLQPLASACGCAGGRLLVCVCVCSRVIYTLSLIVLDPCSVLCLEWTYIFSLSVFLHDMNTYFIVWIIYTYISPHTRLKIWQNVIFLLHFLVLLMSLMCTNAAFQTNIQ